MKLRPLVSVALLAALAACGTPLQPAPGTLTLAPAPHGPDQAAARAELGLPPDGQVYPDGNTYRLLQVEEQPIIGVTVDSQVSSFPKERLLDGDLSTEWVNGGYRNPTSWAAVELAASASLGSIGIKTGPTASGASYGVQVSSDGASWTTVLANQSNTTWQLETKVLPTGTSGRFVRIFWHNSTTNPQPHFSIFELVVNGETSAATPPPSSPSPTPTPNPTPTPTVTPTQPPTGEVTKQTPTGVSASSTYAGLVPGRAIDGDINTQWANGGYREPEAWLRLAFDQTLAFDRVRIKTAALPGGVYYRFETSQDGVTWSAASENLTNTTWQMEEKAVAGSGKYLRVRFFNNANSPVARFSVFEWEVFAAPTTTTDDSFKIAGEPESSDGDARIAFNHNANENMVVWNHYDVYFNGTEMVWEYQILAQRLALDSTPIGGMVTIAAPPAGDIVRNPDVVYNPVVNEYFVTWQQRRGVASEIFTQRLSATGTPIEGSLARTDEAWNPRLAYNGASNEYMLVWQTNVAGYPIRGMRYDAAGSGVGTLLTISPEGGGGSDPQVAASANGYLVSWSGPGGIWTQRLDAAGTSAGQPVVLDAPPPDDGDSGLAFNWQRNEYMVTWRTYDAGVSAVFAQRLSDAGGTVGGMIQVAEPGNSNFGPVVAYNGRDDEYVFVWSSLVNPTSEDWADDIVARRYAGDGTALGTRFVLTDAFNFQQNPAVTYNYAVDRYFAAWDDYRGYPYHDQGGPPDEGDLFGTIFE